LHKSGFYSASDNRLHGTCLTVAVPAFPNSLLPHPQAQLKAQARNKKPERRGCWLWVNAKTLEGALDPLFLAFSLCVSLAAIAAGIFTIIKSNSFNFTVNSWEDFTQVSRDGVLGEYPLLLVAYHACRAVVMYGWCCMWMSNGPCCAAIHESAYSV
jgi:hypothetical protein